MTTSRRVPAPQLDMLRDDEPPHVAAVPWAVADSITVDTSATHLVWHWNGAPSQWVSPGATMLEQFIDLRNAEPDRIAAYARRWGVLGICDHGLPSSHNSFREIDGWRNVGCDGIGAADDENRWVFREPVSAWHRYAGEAWQIAEDAAALRGYGQPREPQLGKRLNMTLDLQRDLNRWLVLGAVSPKIVLHPNWASGDPETALLPVLGGSGLFGALALRLAMACTGAAGLVPCTSCGRWFTPNFAPRVGQRQWCIRLACQRAKRAAASRSSRRRKKG